MTPLIAETAGFFYGNREYSDLPRKHKISIAACKHQCNAPEINCVSLIAMRKDGREGFAVRVGGGQSSTPRLSRHLGVFITREQAMPVMRAIIDVWQGTTEYRMSRVKARLKFMIDDYGPEEFRKLVEAQARLRARNSRRDADSRDRKRSHGHPRAEAVRASTTSASRFTSA